MKSSYLNKLKPILWILLFIPLFFINIRNSHDWGDDFAQYISQAVQIVHVQPQTDTHYIANPDHPFVGPAVYPIGFPLLLAPVYAIFGQNWIVFNVFNSFLLALLGVCCIYFFKTWFSELISILLSLILIYNPWILSFKCEILSDFAFSLLLLFCVVAYRWLMAENKPVVYYGALGIIVAWLILVKSIGIVLLGAIGLSVLISVITDFASGVKQPILKNKTLINNVVLAISALSILLIVSFIVLPSNGQTLFYYGSQYRGADCKMVLLNDLAYYIDTFQSFFHPTLEKWIFVALIIKSFFLTFSIIGFISKLNKSVSFVEFLVIAYLGSICLYPNTTQGFRYLLPMAPFILCYAVVGMQQIQLFSVKSRNFVPLILLLVCLLTYSTGIKQIIKTQSQLLEGPCEPEAQATFQYIERHTHRVDTIAFIKPRALALFTGRFSFTNHPAQDSTSLAKRLTEMRPKYCLLTSDVSNTALKQYIETHPTQFRQEYKNSRFELYRYLKHEN